MHFLKLQFLNSSYQKLAAVKLNAETHILSHSELVRRPKTDHILQEASIFIAQSDTEM